MGSTQQKEQHSFGRPLSSLRAGDAASLAASEVGDSGEPVFEFFRFPARGSGGVGDLLGREIS